MRLYGISNEQGDRQVKYSISWEMTYGKSLYLLAPLYMCYTSNALLLRTGKALVDGKCANNCFLVARANWLQTQDTICKDTEIGQQNSSQIEENFPLCFLKVHSDNVDGTS